MMLNLTEVSQLLHSKASHRFHRSHGIFSFDDVKSHRGFTTASLQRLTQIPQISRNFSFDGVKSHGGFTAASLQRLTQIPQISRIFLLMMLNLTEVSRLLHYKASHRSHRSHGIFLLMVLNLTEVSRLLHSKASHRSHRSHEFFF